MAVKWPFTREAMTKRLERASSAQVEMRSFHGTYFPFPGCIAEEVVFRQKTSAAGQKQSDPIITIRKLTIESTFSGLLSKPGRIRRIIAEGLQIQVPEGGANLHAEGVPAIRPLLKSFGRIMRCLNWRPARPVRRN